MIGVLRRVRAGTLLVLLATPAASGLAQEQGPAPQPAPTPLPVPGVLAPPAKRPPGFSVAGNFGTGWDTNPTWQAEPSGSIAGYGNGSLAKTWSSPLFSLTASGNGDASVFQSGVSANRLDYGGGLEAAGALGAHTGLALAARGDVLHNDQLFDPLTAGLLLPVTKTKTLSTTAALTRQLGTRSELGIDGSWSRVMFDSPQLVDGSSLSATARASRGVTARGRVSASYAYMTNDYETTGRTHVHTMAAGYSSGLGRRSQLSLSAGGEASQRGTPAYVWSLYLNALYSVTGRRNAFVAAYRRGVNPGPGFGEDRLLGVFSASFSSAPKNWLSVSLSGSHGNSTRGTGSEQQPYKTDEASASLRARLNRDLGLTLLQEYRRQSAVAAIQALADYRISLLLGYSRTFR